jgi:hypothetical protein
LPLAFFVEKIQNTISYLPSPLWLLSMEYVNTTALFCYIRNWDTPPPPHPILLALRQNQTKIQMSKS